ncbi:transcriptional regulator, TetR family [Parvibaculum lavamentivorans DS-1]|uniref:Transcriptional regulator, TetR family n=1 Tax=Parvibaculum lavamentivorans (strain DS-1 / DSM 13023 / NCIMB 13966) TaxID=402881 RepID=A7HW72_PARL1|nr:TetR/AcrR family transcriptional regulator [Parvibaculum lavamentivorans]ABS64155.1 transcriptional regulator, TetR family [Parvibaculum lavamentivorans DS-1]
MAAAKAPAARHGAKEKILDAARRLIRERGYTATTVDHLCAGAGVTKGAFFHHFESKEALAIAAASSWTETNKDFFGNAPFQAPKDPLDRVLAYVDFRKSLMKGDLAGFTCLMGTMLQETYASNPAIREACAADIFSHARMLEADIAAAMADRGLDADWSARSLSLHIQAVLQGAFILAKAENGVRSARQTCDHLKRYIETLFETPRTRKGAVS